MPRELFSRWTLPTSRPFSPKRQRRRKQASSSFTKLLTTLTARSPTRSGSARERTIMEQTAGGARNDGIVSSESKDGQVYEHPAPHGYADISRSRGLGASYFVAGTTAGASEEPRCIAYAACSEREGPRCLRLQRHECGSCDPCFCWRRPQNHVPQRPACHVFAALRGASLHA